MHLIMKANYNNENRGEEYSPTHFVLEIEPNMVKQLRKFVKCVKSIKENPKEGIELSDVHFYFGFGIWTYNNEWLDEYCEDEYVFYDGIKLDENGGEYQLEEQPYLSEGRISVDKNGNIQFFCFGKYDDEKIYTCGINLYNDIQEKLGDKLLLSL